MTSPERDSHPTVKPVQLVADAILDITARGDVVLDPFGGSGTTLVAAHKSGRVGHAIELDPLYVDVIVRRIQTLFEIAAINAATGRSKALDRFIKTRVSLSRRAT